MNKWLTRKRGRHKPKQRKQSNPWQRISIGSRQNQYKEGPGTRNQKNQITTKRQVLKKQQKCQNARTPDTQRLNQKANQGHGKLIKALTKETTGNNTMAGSINQNMTYKSEARKNELKPEIIMS